MKTNREQNIYENQEGNALIYVLIAIILFAALSFTLGRQTDSSEANDLSEDKAELFSAQMISYAAQAKSATDQMIFSRTKIDDFDFTRPGEAAFETGTTIDKTKRVYHPDGGGLSVGTLNQETIGYKGSSPVAGWYMNRFNNVDWTKTAGQDVILVAYGIKKVICEHINLKILGDRTIPVLTSSIKSNLVSTAYHGGANEGTFVTDPGSSPVCLACYKRTSLCVKDGDGVFAFYTILQDH